MHSSNPPPPLFFFFFFLAGRSDAWTRRGSSIEDYPRVSSSRTTASPSSRSGLKKHGLFSIIGRVLSLLCSHSLILCLPSRCLEGLWSRSRDASISETRDGSGLTRDGGFMEKGRAGIGFLRITRINDESISSGLGIHRASNVLLRAMFILFS